MKIINTSFRQNNAFHKMKGGAVSSFPSGFTENKNSSLSFLQAQTQDFTQPPVSDPKNSKNSKNKSHKLLFGALALLSVPLLIQAVRSGKLTETVGNFIHGAKSKTREFFTPGVLKIENYSDFLEKTDEYIGEGFIKTRVEKFQSLLGEEKAAKLLNLHDNTLELVETSMANKLLNGILDIPRILLDGPNAVLRGIKKIPFVGKLKVWNSVANLPPLKNRADQKAAMDIFYRLKGMAEYESNPAMIKNEIFGVPKGAAVANYVTKDERGLNRLTTGGVSAGFAAMDYYNLAMYEKNDRDEAKKSAKKRGGREVLRIVMSAGFTYSVLSALSSYVNKNKVLACVAIAGTAFATEVLSRVFTGTPLLPLTSNGAKKLNRKRAEKKAKAAMRQQGFKGGKDANVPVQTTPSYQNIQPQNTKPQYIPQNIQNTKTPQNAAQSAWYQNAQGQNAALGNAFSQFAPKGQIMQFRGEGVSAANQGVALNANPPADNTNSVQKRTNENRNKPFGLKHLVGVALTMLGISLIYCVARTKSKKLDTMLIEAGNFLHNLRKYVSTKDMLVKDKDLKKFFEGFNGLQSEHIKRTYSSITEVEFTKEQAEMLLSKARRGVISIDKDNPIFAKAFLRTMSDIDPLIEEAGQERVLRNLTGSGLEGRRMHRYENAEISGMRFFDKIDDNFVPDYVSTKRSLSDVLKELTAKPKPPVGYNLDGSKHSYGVITDAIPCDGDTIFRAKQNEPFHSRQKFKNIKFTLDLSEPSVMRDGVPYYRMKNAVFNFGKIEETRVKIVIDAFEKPFKYAKAVFTFPLKCFRKLANIQVSKQIVEEKAQDEIKRNLPDLGEFYRDCFPMYRKYKKGRISQEEFAKYIESVNLKPFSAETTTNYSPTALASMSRNFVAIISSYFFVNDFRNEVLLQSDGENKEKAREVTKERIAHKVSNFFLNKFFMEVFNSTFNKQYLSSLLGATTVAAATEFTNESCVRASIGVPTRVMKSREEIGEYEQKHLEAKGIKGAYYRFMARLTGKKMLSEKAEK